MYLDHFFCLSLSLSLCLTHSISNFSFVWTADLKTHFAPFGAVADAFIMEERGTGRPRGFGFVVFDSGSVTAPSPSGQMPVT